MNRRQHIPDKPSAKDLRISRHSQMMAGKPIQSFQFRSWNITMWRGVEGSGPILIHASDVADPLDVRGDEVADLEAARAWIRKLPAPVLI